MGKERLIGAINVRQDIKSLQDNEDFRQADTAMCYLVQEYGDWLIERAEILQEIVDTWIRIEEHGTKEEADDFYTIVQNILSGGSGG